MPNPTATTTSSTNQRAPFIGAPASPSHNRGESVLESRAPQEPSGSRGRSPHQDALGSQYPKAKPTPAGDCGPSLQPSFNTIIMLSPVPGFSIRNSPAASFLNSKPF